MADQRNWDKELAEIDRLMAKGSGKPAHPSAAPAPKASAPAQEGERAAPPVARIEAPASGGRRGLAVWLITLLGPIAAAAMMAWPYSRTCGLMLGVYLVGVLGVVAAAIWAMHTAWLSRRGLAMVVGVATLITGLILVAAEVLPRTGYAAQTLTWTCST